MKKILSMTVVLAAVTLFTACGDDDATYTPIQPLEITASDVLFDPAGGTGSITTNTTGTLQASSTSDWVSLAVQGNQVSVSVPANTSIDGRSAKITLTADGKTGSIVVTQKGMIFSVEQKDFLLTSDAEANLLTRVTHLIEVNAESQANWLTPIFDAATGQLHIAVAPNQTGNIRSSSVVLTSGDVSEHITVTQYDLSQDIYGYYSFDYNTKEGEPQSLLAYLSSNELTIYLTAEDIFHIPVTVDEETHRITAQTGSYVGTFAGAYYVFLLFGEERKNSTTDLFHDTDAESSATIAVSNTGGYWSLSGAFGGSWESKNAAGESLGVHQINIWGFDVYTANSMSTSAHWAMLEKCCLPSLTKLSHEEGQQALQTLQ